MSWKKRWAGLAILILIGGGILIAEPRLLPEGTDVRELESRSPEDRKKEAPTLSAASPRAARSPEVRPGWLEANSPAEFRTIRVVGRVLLAKTGQPVGGVQVVAHAPAESPRHSSNALTDATGHFDCTLEVPRNCRDLLVVGSREHDANPFVTYPSVEELPPGYEEVRTTLVLRRAALLHGTVESSDQRVLVSQMPSHETEHHGWSLASFRPIDSIINADEASAFRQFVRPGRVVLRALDQSDALGPPVSLVVQAGDVRDVGTLRPASLAAQTVLAVTDGDGSPVPGAWVQLSDRQVRLVAHGANGECPHFLTDGAGLVRLPPLSRDSFPLVIGVGAPEFIVQEVTLNAPVELHEVALSRRGRVMVQLAGPGTRVLDSGLLEKLTIYLQAQDPPEVGSGVPRPGEVLNEVIPSTGSGVADPSHHVIWFHKPRAGTYRVDVKLGAATLGSAEFTIDGGAGHDERLAITISDGHPVSVRLAIPRTLHDEVVKRFLSLVLVARDEPSAGPIPIDAGELLRARGEPVTIWVPEPYEAVRMASRDMRLLPVSQLLRTVDLGDLPNVSLEAKVSSPSALLEVQVVGSEGSPVQGRWPIYVLPVSGDDHPEIIALLTDSTGRLKMRVRPGRFEIRTDRSIASPFSRVEANVESGRSNTVLVPIGP